IMWPIVESYVTSGRYGNDMRSAIGAFNMTWMPATIVSMFAIAPLLQNHGEWAIGGLALANFAALLPIARLPREPGEHETRGASNVPTSYPHLLRSARVLLPVSYLLMAALSPILPYRFDDIDVSLTWQAPATATWMIVRALALLVMWRFPGWHGRWGTLLLGGALMAGGFGVAATAPMLPLMLIGLAMFGGGLGIIYYTALYYVMAVGRSEVDASGTHEGLIGAGYAVGPVAGLIGLAIGGGAGVVGVTLTVAALGGAIAVGPYLRRGGASSDRPSERR
ncbi:MAG: MFS transporter, partial [Planctomycetota bacterium]